MIESLLGKLNRLRLNAGKTELKSWKTSTAKLNEAIATLEAAGAVDVLPGANLDVKPVTDDPEIAKVRPPENETPPPAEEKPKPKTTKVPTGLARGIDVQDTWTRHSREKMKDSKAADKAALKLSDADKKQIKDEAEARGKVDAKKEPEKAARQQKHIADKKAAREAKGEKSKPTPDIGKDHLTIADLAREIGREPKIVRSKLRRPKYADAVAKLRVKGRDDWVFPKSARDELLKIIK